MTGPCPMPDGSVAQLIPYDLDKHPFYGIPRRSSFIPSLHEDARLAWERVRSAARAAGISSTLADSVARCYVDHTPTLRRSDA